MDEQLAKDLANLEPPESIDRIIRFLDDLAINSRLPENAGAPGTVSFGRSQPIDQTAGAGAPGQLAVSAQLFVANLYAPAGLQAADGDATRPAIDPDLLARYQIGAADVTDFAVWLRQWNDRREETQDIIPSDYAVPPAGALAFPEPLPDTEHVSLSNVDNNFVAQQFESEAAPGLVTTTITTSGSEPLAVITQEVGAQPEPDVLERAWSASRQELLQLESEDEEAESPARPQADSLLPQMVGRISSAMWMFNIASMGILGGLSTPASGEGLSPFSPMTMPLALMAPALGPSEGAILPSVFQTLSAQSPFIGPSTAYPPMMAPQDLVMTPGQPAIPTVSLLGVAPPEPLFAPPMALPDQSDPFYSAQDYSSPPALYYATPSPAPNDPGQPFNFMLPSSSASDDGFDGTGASRSREPFSDAGASMFESLAENLAASPQSQAYPGLLAASAAANVLPTGAQETTFGEQIPISPQSIFAPTPAEPQSNVLASRFFPTPSGASQEFTSLVPTTATAGESALVSQRLLDPDQSEPELVMPSAQSRSEGTNESQTETLSFFGGQTLPISRLASGGFVIADSFERIAAMLPQGAIARPSDWNPAALPMPSPFIPGIMSMPLGEASASVRIVRVDDSEDNVPSQAIPIRPEMGQLTLMAAPLRIASPESERSGAAVAVDWTSLAPGLGSLDDGGLSRLNAVLPAGALALYPAIPLESLPSGAINLNLAPSLLNRLLTQNYGSAAAAQSLEIADSTAAARPSIPVNPALPASIVPFGQPMSTISPILAQSDSRKPAGALTDAGGGASTRGGPLDFLGLPVRLAPSLSGRSELANEVALRGGAGQAAAARAVRPAAFQALQSRLIPGFRSVDAEPDLGAWSKAAPAFGLSGASPMSLLSPDARIRMPSASSPFPQLGGTSSANPASSPPSGSPAHLTSSILPSLRNYAPFGSHFGSEGKMGSTSGPGSRFDAASIGPFMSKRHDSSPMSGFESNLLSTRPGSNRVLPSPGFTSGQFAHSAGPHSQGRRSGDFPSFGQSSTGTSIRPSEQFHPGAFSTSSPTSPSRLNLGSIPQPSSSPTSIRTVNLIRERLPAMPLPYSARNPDAGVARVDAPPMTIQRADRFVGGQATGASEATRTELPESKAPGANLDTIAGQVWTLLKRRIAVEAERSGWSRRT